jgi:MFS family permease
MADFDLPTAASDSAEPATMPLPDERARKSALFVVFLVMFVDLLGFGIVLPLLPLYAFRLLTPLYPDQPKMIGAILGMLLASFSFMQFLFAPIWGRISDRIGRRPILLVGLVGSVIFYSLFAYASHVGFVEGAPGLAVVLILLSRVGAGVAGATISTAQAVIADSTPPHKRSHGMALIGAAFGIGFTFGPLLCYATFFTASKAAPGAAAALLSLLALILALRLLPETRRAAGAGRRHWLQLGITFHVLRMPVIGVLVMTFFLATLAFGSLESTLALVNQYLLTGGAKVARMEEMTQEQLDDVYQKSLLIFAYVGLTLMVVQGFIYRRLVSRIGERRMLRFGVLFMLIGLAGVIVVMLAVANHHLSGPGTAIPFALAILTGLVTGFAFMTPSVSALISKSADPTRQGEILGVNQSMSALARILGPAMASSLFFLDESHAWPYVAGFGLMAVVLATTTKLHGDGR